jgi:hypothetical protein
MTSPSISETIYCNIVQLDYHFPIVYEDYFSLPERVVVPTAVTSAMNSPPRAISESGMPRHHHSPGSWLAPSVAFTCFPEFRLHASSPTIPQASPCFNYPQDLLTSIIQISLPPYIIAQSSYHHKEARAQLKAHSHYVPQERYTTHPN